MKTLAAMPALALLAGCASDVQLRGLAARTGTYVENLRSETAQFIDHQNALNAATDARLQRMVAAADARALRAQRQQLAWSSAGAKEKVALFNTATQVSSSDIATRVRATASARQKLTDGGSGEAYAKTQESLRTLAAKPSTISALAGLLSFGREVQDAYDKKIEEAKKAAEEANDEAAAAASSVKLKEE